MAPTANDCMNYHLAVKNTATLQNVQNKEHKKQEKINYIKTLGKVVLLTATQNIVQRGHESAQSDNKGNLMVILQTVAKHEKTMK